MGACGVGGAFLKRFPVKRVLVQVLVQPLLKTSSFRQAERERETERERPQQRQKNLTLSFKDNILSDYKAAVGSMASN